MASITSWTGAKCVFVSANPTPERWILKRKHTGKAEKLLSHKQNAICYLYSSKAVQLFLSPYTGRCLAHKSPCLASQAWKSRACRELHANIMCNSEWEGDSFAPSFCSPARGIRPMSRITFESVSKIARLQESVPQISYLGIPSHIIFQQSLLPASSESQIMFSCWLT